MALRVARSLAEWPRVVEDRRRTVVSVGNFDGLHLGHQRILRAIVERARRQGAIAAAITFDPHPMKVLRPENAPPLIMTLEDRLAGFERLGLDAALILTFDEALAQIPAAEFVKSVIVDSVRACCVLVGANFRYGHKQAGDVALLQELGRRNDFTVEIAPSAEVGGTVVSSTAIRRAVAEGRMEDAALLLGRPFALSGGVVGGEGRGGKVVVPTLNLKPNQELLPMMGVYVTETVVDGKSLPSVTNVGTRPTFDGNTLSVETFVLDSRIASVPGVIVVKFCKRLRDEMKFPSPDALRAQIQRDIEQAKQYFAAKQLSNMS
ncbi:MAG TPA: bifunctional riboflavin kinase/FAD synthetase [Candidatus Acidoferrum sp.]|nr:bifunctional riboflavin kinase/FAD synthetase [Candidatus Acidoferrum sp.]